jgi:hypothetical protein
VALVAGDLPMSDREDFQVARDAGLKARHETRLARAQAVIPDEVIAAAQAAFDAVVIKQGAVDDVNGQYQDCMRAALEAALPHLRPHETREARAIRREVAEEIAAAIKVRQDAAGRAVAYEALALAARIAREIGSKEAGE